MRKPGWVLVLSCALMSHAACGGSPSTPSSPDPGPVVLPDGNYLLRINSVSAGCFTLSTGQGGAPSSTIAAPVTVARAGREWHLRVDGQASGTLTATLSPAADGTSISGSTNGILVENDVTVRLQHTLSGSASRSGASVAGTVDGQVSYENTTASTVCPQNVWVLLPR
jgi:hypothetical protein